MVKPSYIWYKWYSEFYLGSILIYGKGLTRRLPRCLYNKESICQCRRRRFDPWAGKIHWSREWLTTPVFLPGKSHGQRSLVSCSPRGHKESDWACTCAPLPAEKCRPTCFSCLDSPAIPGVKPSPFLLCNKHQDRTLSVLPSHSLLLRFVCPRDLGNKQSHQDILLIQLVIPNLLTPWDHLATCQKGKHFWNLWQMLLLLR